MYLTGTCTTLKTDLLISSSEKDGMKWTINQGHYITYTVCMTYHRVCNCINKKGGVTGGTETHFPSWAHEFTRGLSRVRVSRFLIFYSVFCKSLFFVWSLYRCCLFFIDLGCLLTTLVSSNSSYNVKKVQIGVVELWSFCVQWFGVGDLFVVLNIALFVELLTITINNLL